MKRQMFRLAYIIMSILSIMALLALLGTIYAVFFRGVIPKTDPFLLIILYLIPAVFFGGCVQRMRGSPLLREGGKREKKELRKTTHFWWVLGIGLWVLWLVFVIWLVE